MKVLKFFGIKPSHTLKLLRFYVKVVVDQRDRRITVTDNKTENLFERIIVFSLINSILMSSV